MPDDQQLLHRYAADGSEAAFGELVARYVNLVYSAALRHTGVPGRVTTFLDGHAGRAGIWVRGRALRHRLVTAVPAFSAAGE